MLKIIAGISPATSGEVFCTHNVVVVLALGLGFHPRLTGLENLQLAGMMLGMSRRNIQEKKDWIIDFSELHEYIDRPLTSYSTGMKARLSFAVAASQEPDILIIDEALATGDIRFVQKCIRRIHDIVNSGSTALFVSHNIWSIKKLTQRSILLDEGKIIDDGDTARVTDHYYEVMLKNEVLEGLSSEPDFSSFVGTGEVKLRDFKLLDRDGESRQIVYSGEPIRFLLEIESNQFRSDVAFSLECWRYDGVSVFVTGVAGGSLDHENKFCTPSFDLAEGRSSIVVELPTLLLAPGDFYLNLHIYDVKKHSGYTSSQQYFFKTHVFEFGVRREKNPNRAMVYYQPTNIYLTGKNDGKIQS
jgi:ABC-type polysaccharide/polyol phosphate transport system ATPase subunit